jgi:glycosyltransferase involved in cell wall biosynthesis
MRNLRHKDIRYVIVGGGSVQAPAGVEVENWGWRNDLHDLYRNVTALIRFTPRDGLSLMVVEALSFGRHVLWTQPLPFVRRIRRYRDMEREVLELLEAHERGELRPQTDASAYALREYSPERCMQAIAQAWEDAALHHVAKPTVAVQAP